jgi:hypothetical protein
MILGSVHLMIKLCLEDALSHVFLLEIKHLQNKSIDLCICTFKAYRLGERLKDYHPALSKTTSQFGIGFKNTNPSLSRQNKEGYLSSYWMRLYSK